MIRDWAYKIRVAEVNADLLVAKSLNSRTGNTQ